jgi:hypothetical protein
MHPSDHQQLEDISFPFYVITTGTFDPILAISSNQ